MKKLFLSIISSFLTISIILTSCTSSDPKRIVEDTYSFANEGKYSKILPFIVPDSIASFNDKEQEQFEKLMKEVMPDEPVYSSFTIENVDENPDSLGYLNFTVNTAFNDGLTYTEKGQLFDDNGKWKILLKPETKVKNEAGYSVKDNTMPSGELLRNMEYAYDIVLSSRGIPEFQLKAARHYRDSVFVKQDLNKYITLLNAASDKENPEAMYELGNAYINGDGVIKNESKANDLYLKAANGGNAEAMNDLANNYQDGIGVPKDLNKAIEWYQKAVDLGDTESMNDLAFIYKDEPNYKNLPKALELLNEAIAKGDKFAMFNLGYNYIYGSELVAQNIPEGIKLLEMAAEKENMWALSELGQLYYIGEKVPQDYSKAYYWFNKADEQGIGKYDMATYKDDYAIAEFYLGECYEYGRGVAKDLRKAKEHYQKAATYGKKEGQIRANRL